MLTSDFSKLHHHVLRQCTMVQLMLDKAGPDPANPSVTHAVIGLDNLYVEGLRAFTLGSMSDAKCRRGSRAKPDKIFNDQGSAAAFIVSTLNPNYFLKLGSPKTVKRKNEPTLRDPSDVLKILDRLNASNVDAVKTAAAYPSSFRSLLPTFRNFFAHRNQNTTEKVSRKVRDLGIPGSDHPANLLFEKLPHRPVRVYEDWFVEIKGFFDAITW